MRVGLGRLGTVLLAVMLIATATPVAAYGGATKTTVTLSQDQSYVIQPSISGKLIAWVQWADVGVDYQVVVRRSNGTIKRVSAAGHTVNSMQGPSAFGGRYVVWSQIGDDGIGGEQWNLFCYDDVADTTTQMSHSAVGQVMPAGNGMTLVWVAKTPGGDTLVRGTMPALADVAIVRTITGYVVQHTSLYGSQAGYVVAPTTDLDAGHYMCEDIYTNDTTTVAEDSGGHPPTLTAMSHAWWAWDMIVDGEFQVFAKKRGETDSTVVTMLPPTTVNEAAPSLSSNCIAYSGQSGDAFGLKDVVHRELLQARSRTVSSGGDTRFTALDGRSVVYTQRWDARWGLKLTKYTVSADRIGGADRFAVAADAARASYGSAWAGAETVIVASGDNAAAADPLAASGLCWKYDAPLLLVSASKMPAPTWTALQQIKAANPDAKVIVIGGAGSVPEARMAQMRTLFGAANVERLLATGDRYDMAAKIAERMRLGPGGRAFPADPVAFIANGADPNKFFDALSLSAVTRASGNPILLVKYNAVTSATGNALAAMHPAGVVVAGGTGTISAGVYTAVSGDARWWGADRYETSKAVAQNAIANGYNVPSDIALAAKLPDGLSGGAMVGRTRGVLLVSKGTGLSAGPSNFVAANSADIWKATVLGGTGSVYPAVVTSLNTRLNP